MKKFALPFFCSALLLLIGAGCSSSNTKTSVDQTSTTTREQQAYVYCSNKGYTPKIRFDTEVNRNRLYCVFENGRECDALQYMDKKCDPKKVAVEQDINSSLTPPESRFNCEPIAKPVCTTEGQTYTNRCTAEAQGKQVKYDGVCSEKDEPFVLEAPTPKSKEVVTQDDDKKPSVTRDASWPAGSGSGSSSSKTSASTQTNQNTNNYTDNSSSASSAEEWIPNLTALLESSSSPYPVTLSECKVGSKKYYYQKEDCSSCFKILYKETGETACYPGLDDSQCPAWSERNCKVIWKK